MTDDTTPRAFRTRTAPRPRRNLPSGWLGAALVTVSFWMLALPAIESGNWLLSALVTIALGIAGGLALLRPISAAVLAGIALTAALPFGPLHVGLAIFVSPIAIAACTAAGKRRAALLLGAWHWAVLTSASILEGRDFGEILVDSVTWLFLLGLAIVVGTWIRHLVDRIGAERERRVLDLAEQRRALARELHDTAVRATTEVVLYAENAANREGVDRESAREFARISRTARLATDELRTLMETLRAAEENDAPLDETLLRVSTWRDVLDMTEDRLRTAGFTVRVSSEGEESLPPRVLAILGRCLEEVRANIVRHGDRTVPVAVMSETSITPTSANARASREGLAVDLAVLNGIIPDDALHLHGGAGLPGVRERLAEIGGRLDAHAEGTMFMTRITIPQRTETP